jgi:sugar transferase (PEP-CTERM/EpsH1 system associated)
MGGMENGLVNLVNHIDPQQVRHTIICMTNATEFRDRIAAPNVGIVEIGKNPYGRDFAAQRRVYAALRTLKPDVLHTRNLTGLDAVVPGFLARVPARLHGEHGRDMTDPDGTNKKFILLKKLHAPFIQRWVCVSQDLAKSLVEHVNIPTAQITHICNGVDLSRFSRPPAREPIAGFSEGDEIVFGTVGRLQDVKEQWLLIEALVHLKKLTPNAARVRVVIVGDGPMRARLEQAIADTGAQSQVLLAGPSNDVPSWLKKFDVFCLPSRAEGISNTILEAMASGLPVLATRVGGNPELVVHGQTGTLVPHSDVAALAGAMAQLINDADLRRRYAEASFERAHAEFSIETMVARYTALYLAAAKR